MEQPIRPEVHKIILSTIERLGLVGIAFATVIAASADVMEMFERGRITLADLLLMFIYLEVLAMVGHYFETQQLPVRFPLYIGIVALARYLILDMKALTDWRIVAVSASILILTIAVLVLRYGHIRFPYKRQRRRLDHKHNTGPDNRNEEPLD